MARAKDVRLVIARAVPVAVVVAAVVGVAAVAAVAAVGRALRRKLPTPRTTQGVTPNLIRGPAFLWIRQGPGEIERSGSGTPGQARGDGKI